MPMKPYTHAKGFNVTSLQGVSGIYMLLNKRSKILYVGKSESDFKNRINTHNYGGHGKLSSDIHFINVIIADPTIYPLYVLEHLFIWCFLPPKNNALWFFWGNNEKQIIETAKKKNLIIHGSVKEFILSFESVVIEREWEDKFNFIRYGEQEQLSSKKVYCEGKKNCFCFKCLFDKESKWEILK